MRVCTNFMHKRKGPHNRCKAYNYDPSIHGDRNRFLKEKKHLVDQPEQIYTYSIYLYEAENSDFVGKTFVEILPYTKIRREIPISKSTTNTMTHVCTKHLVVLPDAVTC